MARYVDLDEMVDVKIYDESCKDWVWDRRTIESVLSMCSGYSVYGSDEIETDFSGLTGYREPKKVELKYYSTSPEYLMCQVNGFIDNQIVRTFEGEWSKPKELERKVLSIPFRFFRMFKKQMEQLNVMVPEAMNEAYERYKSYVHNIIKKAAKKQVNLTEFFYDSEDKYYVYYLNVNEFMVNVRMIDLKRIIAYADWETFDDETFIVVPENKSEYFLEMMWDYGIAFYKPEETVDITQTDNVDTFWQNWWTETKQKLSKISGSHKKDDPLLSITYVGHKGRNLLCRIKGTLEDESRKIFKGRWVKAEDFSGYYLSIPLEQFPTFQSEMELKNVEIPKEMADEYDRCMNNYVDNVSTNEELKSVQQLMKNLVNSSVSQADND